MGNIELEKSIMQIIAFSGDSISFSMEAMDLIACKDYQNAKEKLINAEKSLREAHQIHTDLLVYEANNKEEKIVSCLLIHASTHLSNAELSKELVKRLLKIFEERG